jgi:hypothetical protein
MSQRFKNHEKRIELLFNNKFDDLSRRPATLAYYKSYLEVKLNFPVHITGIEDFSWEDFIFWGQAINGNMKC